MVDKLLRDYGQLKFCPVCAKKLEASPTSGLKVCFSHGDFDCTRQSIIWDTGQYQRNDGRITTTGEYPPTGTRRHP